jgi:Protein of unknown function (DUF4230)
MWPRRRLADTRDRDDERDILDPPPPMVASRRPLARLPWWVGLPGVLAVLFVLLLAASQLSLLPDWLHPFSEKTKDRTGPALLQSIEDMSRYEGASGNFQVVVDLQKDAKFLPDALRGSRTLYVGAGSVDAFVDLGQVDKDGGVTVSHDRTEAVVRLPHAQLEKPALDADRSYPVSQQRGLLNRLGDFFSDNPGDQQEIDKLAVKHIQDAAKDSGLATRAERNTTTMLRGLLQSLGYTKVDVRYGT